MSSVAANEHRNEAAVLCRLAQARSLLELAESALKGVKWRLRANIGNRVRWYEPPEEVGQ